MPYKLQTGDYWLVNWNPSSEPWHQEFFDDAEELLRSGKTPSLVTWRCSINTQLKGDPFLFKRGSSSKHAGIFAFGTIAEDREDWDTIGLQFKFVAPLGNEYPLKNLRKLDPPILRYVASGHSVSAGTASTIIGELKSEDSPAPPQLSEGKIRETRQNKRERNAQARIDCLTHFGDEICQCCGINFVELFGELGRILHCHHREDLAIRGEGIVDGVRDLVPVCPNCHAMLHFEKPAIPVSKLSNKIKRIMKSSGRKNAG